MSLPGYITAAVVALGAASIATSVRAADPAVCNVMASVAYGADTLRQDGYTQRAAAGVLGAVIGGALSNEPDLPLHARQRLANAVGRWGTAILTVVYSEPPETDPWMRRMSPQITGEVVWDMCMRGLL